MAASVRIEGEAFSDIRYEVLANACQLADADHARGKMLKLWQQCTAQNLHVLPRSIVAAVLGVNGPAGIVESGLGDEHHDGIRIRGTEGRIEWLAKLRENAAKGGAAKAAKRLPNGNPEGSQMATQKPANTLPPPCPPTPTPTPTPIHQDLFTPPTSGKAEQAEPKAKKAVKRALPEDWAPNAKHAAKAQELGVQLGKCAEEFRNYWGARGDTMKNWDLAFFTWLGNAVKFAARASGKAPEQPRYLPVISDTTGAPDPEPWKDWL